MASQFPKKCTRCSLVHHRDSWMLLKYVGTHDDGFEKLEYRNCVCKTTLIILVEVTCPVCGPLGRSQCDCTYVPQAAGAAS